MYETDGKLNSHKEYHRYMQACSTIQSKYLYSKYVLYINLILCNKMIIFQINVSENIVWP